jgi:hypothetical protein
MQIILKKTHLRDFEKQVKGIVNEAMTKTFAQMGALLLRESEILTEKIAQSPDFNSLKGKFVGEFGFTTEEVAQLDNILQVIKNNGPVTQISVKAGARHKTAILQWVDIEALKEHPLAQHDLTRLNPNTGQFELTETISWVEWLEEGETIRGYQFFKVTGGKFAKHSRSGQGLMRQIPGGLWQFEPTKIFETTGKRFNVKNLKRGFGLIFRSNLRA